MANKLQYAQGENVSDVAPNSIGAGDTSITVNTISKFNANGGPIIINRGSSDAEVAIASGISGSSLVIAQRGAYGTTAVAHNANAVIESVPFASQWNDLVDTLKNGFSVTDGSVDTTKLVTLAGIQTLANKTLTTATITDSASNVMARSLKSATTTVDVSAATAPTSGQVLTATGGSAATWQTPASGGVYGSLGTAAITSTFTTTTTPAYTDVTGLSITVTVPAGRTVRLTGFVPQINCTASGVKGLNVGLFEGATQLSIASWTVDAATSGYDRPGSASAILTPSTGSHTYKVAVNQTSAGTITLAAGGTQPAYILAELL